MASPTPLIDSLPRENSIGSFGEQGEYLSLSPLADSPLSVVSGPSPPVSDTIDRDCDSSEIILTCENCKKLITESKYLTCFHTICNNCLENHKFTCPRCNTETIEGLLNSIFTDPIQNLATLITESISTTSTTTLTNLSPTSTASLSNIGDLAATSLAAAASATTTTVNNFPTTDCSTSSLINSLSSLTTNSVGCTGCRVKDKSVLARCVDCANYLCISCVMAHQFMHCFDGHRLVNIKELNDELISPTNLKTNGLISSNVANILSSSASATSTTTTLTTNGISNGNGDKIVNCLRHKNEMIKYFCRTCLIPICKECLNLDHPEGIHEYEHINEAAPKQIEAIQLAVQEAKTKSTDVRNVLKNIEHASSRLQVQYHKAQNEINDTFMFYRSMLDERKQELLKELESIYSAKQLPLSCLQQKGQDICDQIYKTCDFVERLNKCASVVEILMIRKLLDSKLSGLLNHNIDYNLQQQQSLYELEFVSNFQAIQVGVRNTFGYIRSNSDTSSSNCTSSTQQQQQQQHNGAGSSNSSGSSTIICPPIKQPPIARPTLHSNGSSSSGSSVNGGSSGSLNGLGITNGSTSLHCQFGLTTSSSSQSTSPFESNIISKRFNSVNSLGPFSSTLGELNLNNINGTTYEKWSNGCGNESIATTTNTLFQNGINNNLMNGTNGTSTSSTTSTINDPYSQLSNEHHHHHNMLDLQTKLMSSGMFPLKSQIKRQKMMYHCKFGEFGVLEGQFTEPSGVAVNAQNDIIVADTNNHCIQIFDKEGRFKFQFGECGKRDGQLLYPNRVAVVRTSGDIIVTERSPTHQIQIYNQYGQFVRIFGATILQHPRGVTVDNKGRIVVVECKVMRVIIFDQTGTVLQKFGCSKHLEFPNGVVVNDKQEIFISDNRAHCVKVFSYEGIYLRQIGGEGVTNYPIGVGINTNGEILIADNHNNFNLTIFTQDGQLVSALESKMKHAQCFDVALMDDGSVVLASKDYRLYIYRYVQVPPIGL